jgi:hypothetical protein
MTMIPSERGRASIILELTRPNDPRENGPEIIRLQTCLCDFSPQQTAAASLSATHHGIDFALHLSLMFVADVIARNSGVWAIREAGPPDASRKFGRN